MVKLEVELVVVFDFVVVVDGLGTITGPVGGTISVAIMVACVSGAALGSLSHMAYALATVSAAEDVSTIKHAPYTNDSRDSHPTSMPSQAPTSFSATIPCTAPSPVVYPEDPV